MYKINIENAQNKVIKGFLFNWSKPISDKPYLLFIHGAWHGSWCYEQYFTYFNELGYNVAAVDLPNRAGIPKGNDFLNLSIKKIAKTIHLALEEINEIKSFIAIGHSMGALMAGKLATMSNETKGLILLSPSPNNKIKGAKKMPLVDHNKICYMSDFKKTSERFWPHIKDEKLKKELFEKLNGETPYIVNERYSVSVNIPWNIGKCPVLVVEAELDNPEIHPPMQDRNVAEFYQGDYVLAKGLGHCLMLGDNYEKGAIHIKIWLENNNILP